MDITKDSLIQLLGGGDDSFTFMRSYTIHLVPATLPHLPPGIFGGIGYRVDGIPTYQQQPFFMSRKDQVAGKCDIKEVTAVIRLGEALERRYHDQGYQVIDIQLPASYGFSGHRYPYWQTRDLFPHLA